MKGVQCPPKRTCSSMDRASGFGPEGWGFESSRVHRAKREAAGEAAFMRLREDLERRSHAVKRQASPGRSHLANGAACPQASSGA